MEPTIVKLYEIYQKNSNITIDSRKIPHNSIFFALRGERFNGNEFALEAIKNGASIAVVDEKITTSDDRIIQVRDVLQTLQELARYHRNQLNIKVIGITGTNGKTTTKELIQRVLLKKYKSMSTQGNLNNHIGVPLTLLTLTKQHDFAVVEMGANHIGEISRLCYICSPDFGLITNIGKAHLEGFGGFEGVVKAKTELYDFIRESKGRLFVNRDNSLLMNLSDGIDSIYYGEQNHVDCKGELVNDFPYLDIKCTLKGKSGIIKSRLVGRYNFENILASVCIGNYFNVGVSEIREAIGSYQPENNRSQIVPTKNCTLILDAYNANPSSMKVAIEHFATGNYKNKVLILGDMAELGKDSYDEHKAVLDLVKLFGFKSVILIGPEFTRANQAYGYEALPDTTDLPVLIAKTLVKNSTVLVKGSRKMQLEKIVDLL